MLLEEKVPLSTTTGPTETIVPVYTIQYNQEEAQKTQARDVDFSREFVGSGIYFVSYLWYSIPNATAYFRGQSPSEETQHEGTTTPIKESKKFTRESVQEKTRASSREVRYNRKKLSELMDQKMNPLITIPPSGTSLEGRVTANSGS